MTIANSALNRILCAILLLPVVSALAPRAAARVARPEDESLEGRLVAAVRFSGDSDLRPESLAVQMRTQVGHAFSAAAANQDMKTLFERLRILATSYRTELTPSGEVVVIFEVHRFPIVRQVRFVGNDELDDQDLYEALHLSEAGIAAQGILGGQQASYQRRLLEVYEEKGFRYAEVQAELREVGSEVLLEFHIREGPEVRVDDIIFEGLSFFTPGDLTDLMETSESFWFFTRTFRERTLYTDLVRIEGFLHDEGFLDARVALEAIRPSEDFSEVDLVLRIDQGKRWEVGEIRIEGNESFSEEELRQLIRMKPGDPFRYSAYRKDHARVVGFYRDRGYIRVEVPVRPREIFAEEGNKVVVNFEIAEKQRKRIRDIRIEGNLNTADEVIRRELYFYPGQVFDQSELDYAQDRLRATGFFDASDGLPMAWIDTRETDDPAEEDVVVTVEDGPSGFMSFLFGVGSGVGFFVGVSVDKQNFDLFDLPSSPFAMFEEFFSQKAFHGGGQRLRLRANPGSRFSNYLIDFEEPYLTGPIERPVSFEVSGFIRDSIFRLYDESRVGGIFSLGKRITRDSKVTLGTRIERVEISDLQQTVQPIPDLLAVAGGHSIRGLISSFYYQDYDFVRNPTEGYRIDVDAQVLGGPFTGNVDIVKASATSEVLFPLYENEDQERHVLAVRGTTTYASEYSDTDNVPLFERYFAGGTATSLLVRGFDFRGMGPHQAGESVGGNGGVTVNTEYIFPLHSYYESRIQENVPFLRGVVFVDQGMLEPTWGDLGQGTWRIAVGIGIRVKIPLQLLAAPLEVYYGIPLRRAREDEREAISISFSTRF